MNVAESNNLYYQKEFILMIIIYKLQKKIKNQVFYML